MSDKGGIVTLDISTYRGMSFGAIHYYGQLINSGNGKWEKIELRTKLTSKQAKELSKKDDWDYRAGQSVTRFETRQAVIDVALREYKAHFPGALILLCGSPTTAEPIEPIDGPESFMEDARKIYSEYDAFEWIGRGGFFYRKPEDQSRIRKLTDSWCALLSQVETNEKEY